MSIKEILLKDIFSKPISGEWGDEPDEKDFVKIIKTNNILNTGRINYNNITLRKIDHKAVELKKLQYGDILIEKSGGSPANPVGRVCFFENDADVYLTNNFMSTLRVSNEHFYHQYVFYALYFLYIKRVVLNFQNQTTGIINLKLDRYLSTIKIKQIDLTRQKEIANSLHKAQELIELRKTTIEKLDELAQSIFIDMFGDPVSNSKGLKTKKLTELTEIKTGKTPSRKEPLYWENGTELWATTTEVNQKYISDTNEKITMLAVAKNNLTVYPKNTILMAMYGQGKTRGKVALLLNESTINQAFCAILPNKSFNTKFLLSLLENSYEDIRSLGRGGNQENLNLDIVKNYEVIYPEIDDQNEFAKKIEKIESQKSLYEAELTQLQATFDALLSQSFEG